MSETRTQRRPKRMTHLPYATDGWWYEDAKGVDVYLSSKDGVVRRGRIGWAALLRAAQRSSGREVIVKGGR